MQITRDLLRNIREDIATELKSVGDKHGVLITPRNASFNSQNATMKIEIAVIGDGGVVENKDRTNYTLYCGSYGLKPEWLDKTFVSGRDTYQIIGLAVRRSKNPVVVKRLPDGKDFIFPDHLVKLLMEVQAPNVTQPRQTVAA
jgi:hypothetical protein